MIKLPHQDKNWFNLISKRNESVDADYDRFVQLIKKQIEKYRFKENVCYCHKQCRVQYQCKCKDTVYTITNLQIVVDKRRFEKLCASSLDSTYYPFLTFHATQNPNKINSIVKHGYLKPGDLHPTEGYSLRMATGNLYGDGVYSSPVFDTAQWFNFFDKNKCVQIIVNLVFPGKVQTELSEWYEKWDDSDTRIINNPKICVSKSTETIFPIAILTLNPNWDHTKMKSYFKIDRHLFDPLEMGKFYRTIRVFHLFDDYFMIKKPDDVKLKNPEIKHFLLTPLSILSNRFNFDQINNFANSLHPVGKITAVLNGNLHTELKNKETFRSFHNRWKMDRDKNLTTTALDQLFDLITKDDSGDDSISIIYLFVDQSVKTNSIIEKYKHFTKMKRIIVKQIFVGPPHKAIYRLKSFLQTETFFEQLLYTTEENTLEEILEFILEENKNIYLNRVTYRIPYPFGIVGEGFITNLMELPYWDIHSEASTIYKGAYPNCFFVDDHQLKTEFIEADEQDFLDAVKLFIGLLCRFRNSIICAPERFPHFENTIQRIYESIVGGLKGMAGIKQSYYQLSAVITDIKTFGNVRFEGEFYERLLNMRFGRRCLKRARTLNITDPEGQLLNTNSDGFGIRVKRTAASEIEPWLIQVEYLSLDTFPVNEIYHKSEIQEEIRDSRNKIITDVMPFQLSKAYYGYIFTRNPYLYIPSQYPALITVSLISIIEGIFMNPQCDKNRELIGLAYRFINRITCIRDKQMEELLTLIKSDDNFEQYFTASHGVQSICQILGLLFVDDAKELFTGVNENYSRMLFAILNESIMRACRIFIKQSPHGVEELLNSCLSLNVKTDLDSYKFDLMRAKKHTNKFYRKRLNNCTPFAVVATLGFIERYHQGLSKEEMLNSFINGEITMKNFLTKNLPDEDGAETQVALYLQGIKYNKSKYRQNIRFSDPKQIIRAILDERVGAIRGEQQIRQKNHDKKMQRIIKQKIKAIEYLKYHTVPRIFTQQEISKMNSKRAVDDQLELQPSGLLKHHCCYPDCPDYLNNFCTTEDAKNNQRHGLMNHLQYDAINNNYLPSFHSMGRFFALRISNYFDFKREMDRKFSKNPDYRIIINKDDTLVSIWRRFH